MYRAAEKEWQLFVGAFTDLLTEFDPQIPHLPPKDVIHRIYRDVCLPTSPAAFHSSTFLRCGSAMTRLPTNVTYQRAFREVVGREFLRVVRLVLLNLLLIDLGFDCYYRSYVGVVSMYAKIKLNLYFPQVPVRILKILLTPGY